MDNKISLWEKVFSRPGYKFSLFLISYVIACVITVLVFLWGKIEEITLGYFILGLGFFPIGLYWLFTGNNTGLGDLEMLPITWGIYIIITVAAFVIENSRTSKILYVIFLILLILNINGCIPSIPEYP